MHLSACSSVPTSQTLLKIKIIRSAVLNKAKWFVKDHGMMLWLFSSRVLTGLNSGYASMFRVYLQHITLVFYANVMYWCWYECEVYFWQEFKKRIEIKLKQSCWNQQSLWIWIKFVSSVFHVMSMVCFRWKSSNHYMKRKKGKKYIERSCEIWSAIAAVGKKIIIIK